MTISDFGHATRRDFLTTGLAAGAALPLNTDGLWSPLSSAASAANKTLVVVQIRGGWDWLNILANPDDAIYQAARPNLKLPRSITLPVTGDSRLGWHPAMAPLKPVFDRGDMAVLQNTGYPRPNLSHFTSEKKWAAGDPTVSKAATGWLARWIREYSKSFPVPGVVLGRMANSFTGEQVPSLTNPTSLSPRFDTATRADNVLAKLAMQVNAMLPRDPAAKNLVTAANTIDSAIRNAQIFELAGKDYTPRATYPTNTLSTRLQLAARYITAGLPSEVFFTDTGGWDTHSNQVVFGTPEGGRHGTLITGLAGALRAFLDDLAAWNKADDVIVMLFSEFGRRIGENGSLGTDHGHGNLSLVLGKSVRGGLYGKYPDLTKYTAPYQNKYLRYDADTLDFRRMYAEILDKWLGVDSRRILGQAFAPLGIL